jgi:hypothetical protein
MPPLQLHLSPIGILNGLFPTHKFPKKKENDEGREVFKSSSNRDKTSSKGGPYHHIVFVDSLSLLFISFSFDGEIDGKIFIMLWFNDLEKLIFIKNLE